MNRLAKFVLVCLPMVVVIGSIPRVVRSQVPPAPVCPISSDVHFIAAPPASPSAINSATVTQMGIYVISSGHWDFIPQNILVAGFAVTASAQGQYLLFPGPVKFVPVGILPAGSYSVTINPTATNVTPNVACPALTVPLVVVQGLENVPVPIANGAWAALLASLAGLLGLAWMSRRRLGR